MSRLRCVIKCMSPLDRDPTVEIGRGGFNHKRYNSFFDTCADGDQWSTSASNQRSMIRAPSDPTHLDWPRVLHLKTVWNLVPQGKN